MVKKPKVLLIGWDAADWKVIHPLLDRGDMPALQSLVEAGTVGNLSTLHPVLSPMLWTSIATGKRPYQHGILGFTEPDADGLSVQPVSSLSRSCKAIWNILHQQGLQSNVIGWWPSHPVEPIDGVMISNDYHRASDVIDQPWPLSTGTIHPIELEDELADLRVHPSELHPEQLLPFVPKVLELKRTNDRKISSLGKILAEGSTIQAAATHLIDSQPCDFMAVYFDAIDHFSHGFMRYHPPQQESVSDEDFELYRHVIVSAYRFHDMMLHRLLQSVDEETTVIVMSDHGFHPDHLRPQRIPREPAGPAVEHRDHGIFVIKGPNIRQDHIIHGAGLLDITPTLLTLFDLPVGEDMDGQPLLDIFEEPPHVNYIPSWETVAGEAGRHPVGKRLDPYESQQAIEQLAALGYIDPIDEDTQRAVAVSIREARYNLAQSYMDANRPGEAIPLLEELVRDWPEEYRIGIRLAACYQAMGRLVEQRALVEKMLASRQSEASSAQEQLQSLREAIRQRRATSTAAADDPLLDAPSDKTSEKPQAVTEQESNAEENTIGDLEEPPDEPAWKTATQEERIQLIELNTKSKFQPYMLHYLLASVSHAEGNNNEALDHLLKAEAAEPRAVKLHNRLGDVYYDIGRLEDAEQSYQRVVDTDPEDAQGQLGLGRVALARQQFQPAAAFCLTAIGLQYQMPLAHFVLALSLKGLDKFDTAIDATQMALSQNPRFVPAHELLIKLYQVTNQSSLAEKQQATLDSIRAVEKETSPEGSKHLGVGDKAAPSNNSTAPAASSVEKSLGKSVHSDRESNNLIVTVSGLPRSGTSMMMQMLHAGGMPVLCDDLRGADEDNPRGYFEYTPVRSLRESDDWLPKAQGKCVKIVTQLLRWLPTEQSYRVIYMRRPLEEVLTSQQKMLTRNSEAGATLSPERLAQVFKAQEDEILTIMERREDVELLPIDFAEAIREPEATATKVQDFLGISLDKTAMASAICADLYRNRQPIEKERS